MTVRGLTVAILATAAVAAGSGLAAAATAGDKDCSDFATQQDAQAYFIAQGGNAKNNVDRLDGDHDGIACERNVRAPAAIPAPPDQPVPPVTRPNLREKFTPPRPDAPVKDA